ncbi:fasciclin-like arabinogalactan protein 12 [Cajanus cajan]|uniref:Fasciclin-like arabinogalactan protein 11 n=1 Tax=Cajanus cajan TaxID=3821 RepID=A0A151RFU3_CAJCA|nr:fasciclin-like arabinogalactan protein 12 [Cajanus cajan]KYP41474.1 Fasciclin-like arabinogalactan protein 11 [Cajanus cajan]
MTTKQSLLVLPISLTLLLSLLHSTTVLAAPSPATAPAHSAAPTKPLVPTQPHPSPDNTPDIERILKQANTFDMFLRLMKSTQLINQLNSQLITIKSGGLTLLAPDDGAFSELPPGFLNTLSDAKKLELLQFHVLPDFVSASNFDTLTNPVRTLAGNKPGKVELNVVSYGGVVNVSTGPVNTSINGVVYTDKHLAIYKVGKVLLPQHFFPTKKMIPATPAPAPSIEAAKAPTSDKEKPLQSEDSSESSQVVPVQTSGAVRFSVSSLVLGVVFVGVINLIV